MVISGGHSEPHGKQDRDRGYHQPQPQQSRDHGATLDGCWQKRELAAAYGCQASVRHTADDSNDRGDSHEAAELRDAQIAQQQDRGSDVGKRPEAVTRCAYQCSSHDLAPRLGIAETVAHRALRDVLVAVRGGPHGSDRPGDCAHQFVLVRMRPPLQCPGSDGLERTKGHVGGPECQSRTQVAQARDRRRLSQLKLGLAQNFPKLIGGVEANMVCGVQVEPVRAVSAGLGSSRCSGSRGKEIRRHAATLSAGEELTAVVGCAQARAMRTRHRSAW